MPIINDLSLISIPIELCFNDIILGHASAFIWQEHNINFLITNWHVLTGLNPITKQPTSSQGGRPNNFKLFGFHSDNISNRFVKTFDFYANDGQPQWYEHPIYREKVDVVAIALFPAIEFKVFPLNKYIKSNLKLDIGEDVFILDFPFKPAKENFWLPIWKRGSIATEPEIDQDGLPFLYIDSATRPGMSGSPVIIKNKGIDILSNNDIILNDFSFDFIGVYSGRLSGNEALEAQLGRVWKKKVIAEIIEGKCLGNS